MSVFCQAFSSIHYQFETSPVRISLLPPHLFPLLCGFDVSDKLPPHKLVLHFLSRKSVSPPPSPHLPCPSTYASVFLSFSSVPHPSSSFFSPNIIPRPLCFTYPCYLSVHILITSPITFTPVFLRTSVLRLTVLTSWMRPPDHPNIFHLSVIICPCFTLIQAASVLYSLQLHQCKYRQY